MPHHKQAPRQEAPRPRLKPLELFLSENNLTASEYIRELYEGESAMPPPLITPSDVVIDASMEVRWRNRMTAQSLVRLGQLAGSGELRRGRR